MLLLLLLVATVVGACGGDGDEPRRESDCTPVAPDQAVVDQDRLAFIPEELCVNSGQAVTFKSSEAVVHTVTIEGKNESGTMREGDTFEWMPPGPGVYKIGCDFHPQMQAVVRVN